MTIKAKKERNKKTQKNKILRRKILISALALVLIGGLVSGAIYGFADFLISGDKSEAPEMEEDYLSLLEDRALVLEQTLAESPDKPEIKIQLGDLYLELVRACSSIESLEMRVQYAQRAEELIMEIMDEMPAHAEPLLRLALLAYYQENISQAEEYFHRAVELEENNAEVHLSYGLFLASNERQAEARKHLEKVLVLEPAESYLAELARLSLEKIEMPANKG